MLLQVILLSLLSLIVEESIYLYDTQDSISAEFYDCIPHKIHVYCRRPTSPITLQRDNEVQHCYHGGISYSFDLLMKYNISASVILHEYGSGIEKAEDYSSFVAQSGNLIDTNNNYLCKCTNPQSFGRHCEYLFPFGTTFKNTLEWELEIRIKDENKVQRYGDILCYTTLICDSGLHCLDWRDICDGMQQCMFGYDEENCDKLEFNECEDDEYRCVNGLCIPDVYFLDGEWDYEIGYYNGFHCPFDQVSIICDDRTCLRNEYSCGDGQCIFDKLAFQVSSPPDEQCRSYRDQYFICETHSDKPKWTLPNGRCYNDKNYEETYSFDLSRSEKCIYFLKCVLSQGMEINCPSRNNYSNIDYLQKYCNSPFIMYPSGALFTSYIYDFYDTNRSSQQHTPDFTLLSGKIKCRGYIINNYILVDHWTKKNFLYSEETLCTDLFNHSIVLNGGYDPFCYNNSQTFNKQSYNFIDVCNESNICISAYRIADGTHDCASGGDENINKQELVWRACSKIQHYRFYCSSTQPTCFPVNILNNGISFCNNSHDERWMGRSMHLHTLNCRSTSKDDCGIIRQYITNSWNASFANETIVPLQLTEQLPFRSYCDTFPNFDTKQDEDKDMCKTWWICPKDQWRCRSGQCIDIDWILDGEWDCSDASDEQGFFFTNYSSFSHSLNRIDWSIAKEKFHRLYNYQPFWNICNLEKEFPCFPFNITYPLTTKHIVERPCIALDKLGNNHADCLGGVDERNTIDYCDKRSALGYNFKCLSTETCIQYTDICRVRCTNDVDDKQICAGMMNSDNCTNVNDFRCWNGTCIKNGWCNERYDCSHGEDEYPCIFQKQANYYESTISYRVQKKFNVMEFRKKISLPLFSSQVKIITNSNVIDTVVQRNVIDNNSYDISSSLIAYVCNRGVGIYTYNGSIVCFCPEQYYGDKCQFHSDRLIVNLLVNLSQSNYSPSTNLTTVLKMLVIFLFENEPITVKEFQVRPAIEIKKSPKHTIRFLYPRSNASLERKRQRYFSRSNIIHEHPYTVRIEAYELNLHETPFFIGLWQYPIYFDYLPSFRLVKILRFTKTRNVTNPCLNSSCRKHQQCHQLLNAQLDYICLCSNGFKGDNCSISDNSCNADDCSTNALCRPNYRKTISASQSPYCICPLARYGNRCELELDQCKLTFCFNQGTCFPSNVPHEYFCVCTNLSHGKRCEFSRSIVSLYFNQIIEHRAIVIQYLRMDFHSLNLILISQYVYHSLPRLLADLYDKVEPPEIIIAKQYVGIHANIHIVSLQIGASFINTSIEMSETNRCFNVYTLFPIDEEIYPYKYHSLCRKNHSLFCFFDDNYLCICDADHYRVECFGYDHNLDRCSMCFADGQCLTGDRSKSDNYLCLCPHCRYGRLCQFSYEGLSFTLHSALLRVHYIYQIIYLILSNLIFVFGILTNYATLITFIRPNLRSTSVGSFLFFYSMVSQTALFALTLKSLQLFFEFLLNDILCKIISYVLSVSIRYSFWLLSWVAVIRVCSILFPFSTLTKNNHFATRLSFFTLIAVACMDIHELLFYIKDPSGQPVCIVSYPRIVSTYERITLLIHYIVPFCIQILSITSLIILAARSRSRATNHHDTFVQYLQQQFRNQKELYITPIVIIFSGLPQVIFSFSFSCIELATWQKHLLLIAYFLAYAPQSLGFVLFVLPSTRYLKEFQATKLSKIFHFRSMKFNK
ncbi:hypothetical protein I4U23_023147 [Adineta vaga]|nr:hypothetical protein I4U23_023147 [Adineta vaga]